MYCVRCGATLAPGQSFCAACGQPTGGGVPAPAAASIPQTTPQTRVSENLRVLAILWFAMSAFRMIPGLVLLTMGGFISRFLPPDVPAFVSWIIEWVGIAFIAGAGIGVLAGWGLLERRPWARMLTIVLGCLSLFDVPFGTALGAYTLWVLLPAQSLD